MSEIVILAYHQIFIKFHMKLGFKKLGWSKHFFDHFHHFGNVGPKLSKIGLLAQNDKNGVVHIFFENHASVFPNFRWKRSLWSWKNDIFAFYGKFENVPFWL